jgi:hypothetical protein
LAHLSVQIDIGLFLSERPIRSLPVAPEREPRVEDSQYQGRRNYHRAFEDHERDLVTSHRPLEASLQLHDAVNRAYEDQERSDPEC